MTTTKSKTSSEDGTDGENGTPKSSTGVSVPSDGTYVSQRAYARLTGAQNIPAPAKPAPLPASNTLAPGSAAHSRSLAAERTTEAEQRMLGRKPVTVPATRPDASSLFPQNSPAMRRMTDFQLARAADRAAPAITSRQVEGAPGVRRYDQAGQSPLYSNVTDPFDRMKGGGTVSTIPARNMQRPLASASQGVSSALQAAADRGDFRAVRQHYQRGGGTFRNETSEQTALRQAQTPSGSGQTSTQADIDAERSQGAIDRMTRDISDAVRSGNHKGAKVLRESRQDLIQGSAARSRAKADERAAADEAQAGRIDDLRGAVRAQELAPSLRTAQQLQEAELADKQRKQSLMDRIVGVDRDDARKALDQYQAIYHKPTEDRDKYATFYQELPMDPAEPRAGTKKVPFLINQRTGETRPINQQLPEGVAPQQAYDEASAALERGASTDDVNARLLAYGLTPIRGQR